MVFDFAASWVGGVTARSLDDDGDRLAGARSFDRLEEIVAAEVAHRLIRLEQLTCLTPARIIAS